MEFNKYYTESEHAANLLKMLETDNPCSAYNCPSCFITGNCDLAGFRIPCMEFLGLTTDIGVCPCNALGREEAIKLTWLTLEAKGYLD